MTCFLQGRALLQPARDLKRLDLRPFCFSEPDPLPQPLAVFHESKYDSAAPLLFQLGLPRVRFVDKAVYRSLEAL